jgi:hypothetical protein
LYNFASFLFTFTVKVNKLYHFSAALSMKKFVRKIQGDMGRGLLFKGWRVAHRARRTKKEESAKGD